MRTRRRAGFCFVAIALLSLAACQPMQNEGPAASAPAAADTSATSRSKAAAPAVAGTTATGEHVTMPRYKIDISYPPLSADEAPLGSMLLKIAATAKQDFMQALPDPKQFPEFADRQMQLLIDFKVAAANQDFASVRETGMQDTGGAHPIPIDSTVVYDLHVHGTITLDDLFAQPDAARMALADYARAWLMKKIMAQAPKPGEGSPEAIKEWNTNAKQMIDDGTQPTEQNFANFIVRAGAGAGDASPGLTLIFPPYQVAAYIYGTQTVDVPAQVFAQYLKPEYQNAFGIPIAN